jgi:predicted dehydrogenase
MATPTSGIGLAVVGCGVIGRVRARLAREYPGIEWLGLADVREPALAALAAEVDADFATTDCSRLLARPEVTAVIVATDESAHVDPVMRAVSYGFPLFIEKPLATEPAASARVLAAVETHGIDAVVGYTQRFRRRFLAVKERVRDGQIGDVTSVVTRALMNRMVPHATLAKVDDPRDLTPMVVSGTHSLDLCLWLLEGKTPVEVYARSNDAVLGPLGTDDGTFGIITMDDGTILSMNISWALPEVWPGAVYGLEVGIVGTRGVIDIEDTHRDVLRIPRRSPRRLRRELPARRHRRWPALGADARGDRDLVQPPVPRHRHTTRHGGGRPRQPAAEQGHGPVGPHRQARAPARRPGVAQPGTRPRGRRDEAMRQLSVGVIGTGWCGGIRAVAAAESALVSELHIAEIDLDRLHEVAALTKPVTATADWEQLVGDDRIDVIMVSTTPETLHYPMAKAALDAGKHVLLEKPMALELAEADELVETAARRGVKFTVGYSQRFNPKQAAVKRAVVDGSIGRPTSMLVSRHIGRSLGAKIGNRIKLSPAAMEATHDIDFALWCLEPRRPVRVYSQFAWGVRQASLELPDAQMIVITMDDGVVVTVGAGMSLPPGYPNAATTWIECIGTDGAVLVDDSHRDIVLTTMDQGVRFPLSTMPGEKVGATFAGPMERETVHFLEAVAHDRPVMVDPRLARLTMQVYLAADRSAETSRVVDLR